jgi:hypothetical protein
VLGVARGADDGTPVDSARVTIAWTEYLIGRDGVRQVARRVPAAVRPGGMFLFCGVPTDAEVTLRADAPGLESGEVLVTARAGALVRHDVALGGVGKAAARDSAGLRVRAAGGAHLAGLVVDDRGQPLPNARVLVVGVTGGAVAGAGGAFRLDGLPSGSWTIEARAIGFVPRRAAVTLARDAPAHVRLTMQRRAQGLDQVVVRGRAPASHAMIAEFMECRRQGLGAFLTPEEVTKRRGLLASDLLRTMAGFTLGRDPTGSGNVIRGRDGCRPVVAVDGMVVQNGADELDMLLSASDVLAVEAYHGTFMPPQYRAEGNPCGAVVIWMRR